MRVLMALALLAVAGWAAGAPTSSQMSDTICSDCHGPGLWEPAMVEPQVQEYRLLQDGEQWWLEADILNTWEHEMRRVSALLDTSRHAGLAVMPSGGSRTESTEGVLAMDPLAAERSATVYVEVPASAQHVRLTLSSGGTFPHDLDMEVFGPEAQEPCPGVVDGGAGGIDTVEFRAEDLAGVGHGTWEVRITDSEMEVPEEVPFTLTVEVDTAPGAQALAWTGDAGPGDTVTVGWPVALVGDASAPLGLKVQYVSFFEHPGGEPNAAFIHHAATLTIATQDGAPRFAPGPDAAEDLAVPGGPLAACALLLLLAARRRA